MQAIQVALEAVAGDGASSTAASQLRRLGRSRIWPPGGGVSSLERDRLQVQVIRLLDAVEDALNRASASEVAAVAAALGVLSSYNRGLQTHIAAPGSTTLQALSRRALAPDILSKFTGQQAAQLIWALGKIGTQQPALLDGLGGHLMTSSVLDTLHDKDISMIA